MSILGFLKPKNDCHLKFTSCLTYKKHIYHRIAIKRVDVLGETFYRLQTHTHREFGAGLPGCPFRGQIFQIWPFFNGWPRNFGVFIK